VFNMDAEVPGKGRGIVAATEYNANDEIMESLADVSVLYTDYTRSHCARCFGVLQNMELICGYCNRYALCGSCEQIPGRRQWHQRECAPFRHIPEHMRTGDTDYLRFILRYFAILKHGFPPEPPGFDTSDLRRKQGGARDHLSWLATNKEIQDEAFISWTATFSTLVAKHVVSFPPGVNKASIADLLLKIRTNALGFPFTPEATLGWSLHSKASAFNHSCRPNCYMTPGTNGTLLVKAKRGIQKGEELCISYLDLNDWENTEYRRQHLFDQYRFWCTCEACVPAPNNNA